jgi:hypothetical protein
MTDGKPLSSTELKQKLAQHGEYDLLVLPTSPYENGK